MRRLLLSLAAVSLLTACSGGDGPVAPGGSPDISLTSSATSGTVARNAVATTTLTLGRINGYSGAVSLTAEGLPAGVTVQFAPASLAGSTVASVATISVGATAAPGAASITLRASGSGVTAKTVQYALTIPTPAITLATGSTTATAVQGTSVNVPITITRTNGAAGAVTLTAEGLPANVTAVFTPGPIPANETTGTMTLSVGNGAAVGTSTITVRASNTGAEDKTAAVQLTITAAAVPAYTISAAPAALAVTAGQSGQATLTLTKTGGFAGNVALSLEGAPAGVSSAFAPNPAVGTTSTLTINTTVATVPGVYNLTVRGVAAGLTDRTIVVALTVNAAPAIALAATNVTVAQGAVASSAITITRTGGFADIVNLNIANVPANVAVGFNPAAAAGNSSTLTFTVGAGATPGVYNVLVIGTGTGIAAQSTTVTLTITASGGGGGAIAWAFCDLTRVPAWFAYRDGTNGAWTRVNATAGTTFGFTITQAVGAVAYVVNSDGTPDVEVNFGTREELASLATLECTNSPAAGKMLNGSVTGFANADEVADISHGNANASASMAAPTFQLLGVATGPQDLFAVRATVDNTTFSQTPNRLFLQRNVNVANNGTLPVVDFAGVNAFAPATATLTIGNTGPGELFVSQSFESANGMSATIVADIFGVGSTRTLYGVPTGLLAANELHSALVLESSLDGTRSHAVVNYYRTITDRTITLGGNAFAPTLTSSTSGGLARPKARAPIQVEYGDAFSADFTQTNGARSIRVSATRAYFGAATEYDLETPDFAGVDGFLLAWGLLPGVNTTVDLTVFGGIAGVINRPADGTAWKFASRTDQFTP